MKNLLSILKMDFAKTNWIGKNLRLFSCLLCCLILVLGSSFQSLAAISSSSNAFVVNPDYLIGSASNADPYGIATMELTDDDYYIQPFSSLGTVANTISSSGIVVEIQMIDRNTGNSYWADFHPTYSNGRFTFNFECIEGRYIKSLFFRLHKQSLPNAGVYDLSMDYGSDFSYSYNSFELYSQKTLTNAQILRSTSNITSYVDSFSGEFYLSPIAINLGNVDLFYIRAYIDGSNVTVLNGDFAINFNKTNDTPLFETAGSGSIETDYQEGVSGSLSDISSSIGDMSSSMDSAAESLEYISTSQNLIIQGIDNVIMHISDQLYAFWDQLYNLIHEPTYARLGDILDAIRNLDLEITVEMSEVTNAVNKMNQDMQGKLQNVQQTLTGGYDSSSMDSDNQELNSSLNEYEAAENELFDDAKENINSFEFDTDLGEFSTPLTDISYFLGSLFVGLGPMNVVISFSLTLTIAMVLIGWYRFKGGS